MRRQEMEKVTAMLLEGKVPTIKYKLLLHLIYKSNK